MTLTISIVLVLLTIGIASVAAIRVPHSRLSKYELKRLVGKGDPHAVTEQQIEMYHGELYSLLRLLTLVLIVAATTLAISGFGVYVGLAIAIAIVVVYAPLARLKVVAKFPQKYFDAHTDGLIRVISQSSLLRALLSAPHVTPRLEGRVHSRDELTHLIEQSGAVIDQAERDLLLHGLRFDKRTVEDIMVPADQIVSIGKRELLGPLVLDDLHKTKHDRFPVIDKDIHSIVGMLYLTDLLTVDAGKHSTTAEKAMTQGIHHIQAQDSLRHALATLVHYHQDVLIVTDDSKKTLGLLTIEDVTETLFGHALDRDFTVSAL